MSTTFWKLTECGVASSRILYVGGRWRWVVRQRHIPGRSSPQHSSDTNTDESEGWDMKMTTRHHVMPRSISVELYLHVPVNLYDMVLSYRSNFTFSIIVLRHLSVCLSVCMYAFRIWVHDTVRLVLLIWRGKGKEPGRRLPRGWVPDVNIIANISYLEGKLIKRVLFGGATGNYPELD